MPATEAASPPKTVQVCVLRNTVPTHDSSQNTRTSTDCLRQRRGVSGTVPNDIDGNGLVVRHEPIGENRIPDFSRLGPEIAETALDPG